MLIGWHAPAPDTPVRRRIRVGALMLGCVATVLLALIGCTTVTEGKSTVDSQLAQAYRVSVSASVAASSATSSIRESQRQVTLTKRAIQTACLSFAGTAKDAVDKVNAYVDTLNRNAGTAPTEGPAKTALNHSADEVAGNISDALSTELREALNAYVDASRAAARAISPDPVPSVLNRAIDQFNDTSTKARDLCRAAL